MDDVGKLSAMISKKKEQLKSGVKEYFGKRTAEQIQADKEAEQKRIDAENLKKQATEELKYQESMNKQPSRFEEDISKLGKMVIKGGKTVIRKTAPVIKKTVVTVGGSTLKAGKQFAKGQELVEQEERETKEKYTYPSRKPQPQKPLRRPPRTPIQEDLSPLEPKDEDYFVRSRRSSGSASQKPKRPVDPFDDYGMDNKMSKRSTSNDRGFSIGGRARPLPEIGDDDDYFVSSRKSKGKGGNKGKGGFGLGF